MAQISTHVVWIRTWRVLLHITLNLLPPNQKSHSYDLPSCERQCTSVSVVIFHQCVTDVPSQQRLRSTSTNLSTVRKRDFSVFGATFWNSLPSQVISVPLLAILRQRLKTFLFHLSYLLICFLDVAIIFVI